MRISTVLLAMILSVCIGGCSKLSERDLADLQSPNDIVKRQAIEKIARGERFSLSVVNQLFPDGIIEKKAVEIMARQLREEQESEDIQVAVLRAMGDVGKRIEVPVSPIIEKLKHSNPRIRLQAVESLGKIRDPQAVPALVELLKNETNRYPVIWALGEIGDRSAIPALNGLLSSEDKYVRYNANKALAKIR